MDSSISLKDQIRFLRVCHHVSNVLYQSWYLAAARSGWCQATGAPLYIVQVFWPQFSPLSGLCLVSAVLLNWCWCYYFNKVTACLYFMYIVSWVIAALGMCMATAFLSATAWITFALSENNYHIQNNGDSRIEGSVLCTLCTSLPNIWQIWSLIWNMMQ